MTDSLSNRRDALIVAIRNLIARELKEIHIDILHMALKSAVQMVPIVKFPEIVLKAGLPKTIAQI